MKSIYFARHSFAENSYSKPDYEREITNEGFNKIEEQCQLINKHNLNIDLIICSSATRTLQTARFYKQKLRMKNEIIDLDWLYEAYPTHRFLELVQGQDANCQSVMIVAHNPTISLMASNFNHSRNYELFPAGIIKMDFDVEIWQYVDIRLAKESLYLE